MYVKYLYFVKDYTLIFGFISCEEHLLHAVIISRVIACKKSLLESLKADKSRKTKERKVRVC